MPPDEVTNYRVVDMRLGVTLMTPTGNVRNGRISRKPDLDYLAELGYRLESFEGSLEPKPTPAELEEMRASDRYLGRSVDDHPGAIERDMAKGMREMLAPLFKKTYKFR